MYIPRRRTVGPEMLRMRRVPLSFADIQVLGTRGAPPVDERRVFARLVLPELPERLAGACASPSVNTLRNGRRDAVCLHQQFGHAIDEIDRLAFERQNLPALSGDAGCLRAGARCGCWWGARSSAFRRILSVTWNCRHNGLQTGRNPRGRCELHHKVWLWPSVYLARPFALR